MGSTVWVWSNCYRGAFVALGGEVTGMEGGQVGETDFRAALYTIPDDGPGFLRRLLHEAALVTQQMKETPAWKRPS